MRRLLALACAVALMLGAASASAQPIVLSDGTYGSSNEYLNGTWKWERAEPRQTMTMRFERNGDFYYRNNTTGLEHWGTYSIDGDTFRIVLKRSCAEKRTECADHQPPRDVDNKFKPLSANVFMSASER